MSEVKVSLASWAFLAYIKADGGSRRERGSAITAAVRKLTREGYRLKQYHTSYDEAYGFLPRTEIRYEVLKYPPDKLPGGAR